LHRALWSTELPNDPSVEREMAREILSYFVRNPHAADSLEGVARWRLMDEIVRRKLDETEAAIAWLVEQGYLTSAMSLGGTATFRLNLGRIDEAREFVAGAAAPGRPRG
jgi:hypothetical protein